MKTFRLVLLILMLWPRPGHAGAPAHSGTLATADSAETAYTNPAGMVRIDEETRTFGAVIGKGFNDFEIDKSNTTVGGGNPDSNNLPVGIPAFYWVRPLSDDWRFGFSVNIPSGFGSDYGDDWAGRYYTDSFSLVYVGMTPSIAYRINDQWSVGGALNATYSYSKTKTRINNPEPGQPDGKLEYDADSLGITGTLSVLYQLSDRTRFGLAYTGETTSDLEGDLKLRGLGPTLESAIGGLDGADLDVDNVLPQRLSLGSYHELEDGRYITFGATWIDFSEFGTGAVSLEGTRVAEPEGVYDDIWAVTVGAGFPVDDRTTYRVGAFFVSQMVDDDKRPLSMRLDQMVGIGAGVQRVLEDAVIDFNLNLYHLGDAPVDTGTDSPVRGRVVGESKSPYAISVDFAYHW